MDARWFLERVRDSFDPRLEAVVVCKDDKRAFVVILDAQTMEE